MEIKPQEKNKKILTNISISKNMHSVSFMAAKGCGKSFSAVVEDGLRMWLKEFNKKLNDDVFLENVHRRIDKKFYSDKKVVEVNVE